MHAMYDASRPLYLETNESDDGLGAELLQAREDMNWGWGDILDNTPLFQIAFTSKTVLNAQWHSINIEHEALEILHSLQKFHNYFFSQGSVCDH